MINLKKNFLIYGYGVSGKSISKYLKRKKSSYKIYDDFSDLSLLKESINLDNLKRNIKRFDYFIVSPSIKVDKNHILYPYKAKILIDLDFLSLEIKIKLYLVLQAQRVSQQYVLIYLNIYLIPTKHK